MLRLAFFGAGLFGLFMDTGIWAWVILLCTPMLCCPYVEKYYATGDHMSFWERITTIKLVCIFFLYMSEPCDAKLVSGSNGSAYKLITNSQIIGLFPAVN